MEILETKDYSIFKKLEGNRDVRTVQKIINSINEVGYIPMPICVNEKHEVIDGQNRLEALKQLEMPVQYYIVSGIGVKEAAALNVGRSNWKTIDFVNCYATEGDENYIRLLDLSRKHKGIPLQIVAAASSSKIFASGWIMGCIARKEFRLSASEYIHALKKLDWLEEIVENLNSVNGSKRLLFSAIAWCYDYCDSARLKKQLLLKYPLIRPVCTMETLLADISDIYNKGISKRVYFEVLYKESLRKSEN